MVLNLALIQGAKAKRETGVLLQMFLASDTGLSNIFLSQGVLCRPLLLAARGGHKDIVEFLLQNGASPTEEDTVK